MEAGPSQTAMMAAVGRGLHRLDEAPPWVLDDPFALVLVGPAWRQILETVRALIPAELQRRAITQLVARSRYAEDRLLGGRFTQYVLLGAGLDSFAWRRPDLLHTLTVFEVDHPASQAWKRQRVAELGLPESDHHVFVPVDFEVDSLHDQLGSAGFDRDRPAMFCWLGVTFYLTREAVAATLRTIAGGASGSEVVLSYLADNSVVDEASRRFIDIMRPITTASGEPFTAEYTVTEIEQLVKACGLAVAEHPTGEDIVERYFAGRPDGLSPMNFETLLSAVVP